MNKSELRKIAKEIRQSLDTDKISEKLVQEIKNLEIYKNSKNIMIFHPLKHEINLLSLLNDNKNFYLPRINGDDMEVCPYAYGDKMAISSFKTQEPISKPINPNILDIIFVPALMVDKNFHRLGYGKGFYDRFLAQNDINATKIVPIADELITENLPFDEFDERVDMILSENFQLTNKF